MEPLLKGFEPKRILVIQLRQIGDVLLSTPAVRALRKRYPKAHLAYLVEERPGLVLQGNPYLDEIIIRPRHGGRWEPIQTIRRVRQGRFDLVVDFLASPRTAPIAYLSKAKVTISFANRRRRFLYTHPVMPEGVYAAAQKLSLLRVLGIAEASLDLDMPVPGPARKMIEDFFQAQGLKNGRPVVAIEPFHKRPVREWPGSHFARLADLIARELKAHVVFSWGPGKEAAVKEILAQAQEPHVLAPGTDLHQLAALYGAADLYVGNDCGPRHIAGSQGRPTFAILGPTDEAWTPPHDPRHQTVAKAIACRPCNLRYCPEKHHACMKELGPEEVFAALKGFWNSLPGKKS
jgi:lipopolysaccharide heptosyltransferase II